MDRITSGFTYGGIGAVAGLAAWAVASGVERITKKKQNTVAYIMVFVIAAVSIGRAMPPQRKSNYELAAEISKTLPQQVDEITILARVTGDADSVDYFYMIDAAEIAPDAGPALKKHVLSSACSDESASSYLRSGMKLGYNYSLTSGESLADFFVSAEDCTPP